MKTMVFALVLAAGCTKASTANETHGDDPRQGVAKLPEPAKAKTTITLTSVAFADDCGGTPPRQAPANAPPPPPVPPAELAADESTNVVARRCEQTAMQLSVTAAGDTAVQIKSVEVFDEAGKSLGVLAASKPTRWSPDRSAYESWDQKVASGQTALVSYVLSQPHFVSQYESHDRTYTVKVMASAGGVDQPVQTTVMVVARSAPLPT